MSLVSIFLIVLLYQSPTSDSNPRLQLLEQIRTSSNDSSKSALLLDLAKSYYAQNQDTALELSRQSLELSTKLDLSGLQASAYNLIGVCYLIQSEYEKALESHFDALKIRESLGDSVGVMESYLNLGNIYYRLSKLPLAVEQYKISLDIAKALGHERGMSLLYNNLGSYYRDAWQSFQQEEDFAQAKDYLEKSLVLKEKFGDEGGQVQTLIQLSDLYETEGDLRKSSQLITKSLALSRKNQNVEGILSGLNRLARYQRELGQQTAAIQSSSEAFELAKEIQSPFQIGIAAKQLSELYKEQGDYQKAYEFLKIDQQNSDSVFNESREMIREELSAKYENEKKELELQKMEQSEALTSLKLKRNRELLLGSIALGMVLVVLLWLQWKNNRKISLTNQKLSESNALVRKQSEALLESNHFREKLFSIISHDLRGPISSLNGALNLWKSGDLEGDEIDFVLQNVSKETANTTGMLQNILTWARTQMDENKVENTTVVLFELVEEIQKVFSAQIEQKKIHFHNQVPPNFVVQIDKDRLTLIIRNLISNALKFTDEYGTVKVQVDGQHLIIRDTGMGMDDRQLQQVFSKKLSTPGTQGERGSGIGLLLTKDFADSIGVKMKVESKPGEGTEFRLTLPPTLNP